MKDEAIIGELQKFKDKRDYDKNYYHNVIKKDADRLNKKRSQAREYMATRKDRSKDRYEKNKEIILIKNQIRYYKKRDRLEDFKKKKSYDRAVELKLIDPTI